MSIPIPPPEGERYLDADGDGQPDVAPAHVGPLTDAKNRGWRTLLWGLTTDVLVVLVLFLLPLFSSDSFDWTTTDWKILGLSLAKTVVVAVLSYAARVLGIQRSTITR